MNSLDWNVRIRLKECTKATLTNYCLVSHPPPACFLASLMKLSLLTFVLIMYNSGMLISTW